MSIWTKLNFRILQPSLKLLVVIKNPAVTVLSALLENPKALIFGGGDRLDYIFLVHINDSRRINIARASSKSFKQAGIHL